MGNIFARCKATICCKSKLDRENSELKKNLKYTRKIIKNLKSSNSNKNDEIFRLQDSVTSLNNTIEHYDDVLSSPKRIANAILKSDLNCEWLNDDKEKEYIISIIKFLNVACNDPDTFHRK